MPIPKGMAELVDNICPLFPDKGTKRISPLGVNTPP
jgi:hypothetical protein